MKVIYESILDTDFGGDLEERAEEISEKLELLNGAYDQYIKSFNKSCEKILGIKPTVEERCLVKQIPTDYMTRFGIYKPGELRRGVIRIDCDSYNITLHNISKRWFMMCRHWIDHWLMSLCDSDTVYLDLRNGEYYKKFSLDETARYLDFTINDLKSNILRGTVLALYSEEHNQLSITLYIPKNEVMITEEEADRLNSLT